MYSFADYKKEVLQGLEDVDITRLDLLSCARTGSTSRLNMKRFLNRLGGLPSSVQQNLFAHFNMHHKLTILRAKAEGKHNDKAGSLNSVFGDDVADIRLDPQPFGRAIEQVHQNSDHPGVTTDMYVEPQPNHSVFRDWRHWKTLTA